MCIKTIIPYILFFVIPLLFIISGVFSGYFGVEITRELLHLFGKISICLLVIMLLSLAKCPVFSILDSYNKAIGISSFLFALLHVIFYTLSFGVNNFIFEILQRKYIIFGFLLFILMFLMFIFSFGRKKAFSVMSTLLLPFTLLGTIHYLFATKIISSLAIILFLIVFILLCYRNLQKKV